MLWSWSYGSWIYNYLYNQCLSPLTLWVKIPLTARCTRYNNMWWSLSVTCDRSVIFSGTPDSSTSKTESHDINEILWKVALNTINITLTLCLVGPNFINIRCLLFLSFFLFLTVSPPKKPQHLILIRLCLFFRWHHNYSACENFFFGKRKDWIQYNCIC